MVTVGMDAHDLLILISHFLYDHYGSKADIGHSYDTPRQVGAFGNDLTDCRTFRATLNGERFFISIEKDPNQ